MLGWIFKKKPAPVAAPVVRAPAPQKAAKRPPEQAAPVAPAVDWAAKLQEAAGDDAALLALARSGAPLDAMLSAVGAITGEATLKLAEKEFRNKDRRVHRLAKQRHLAAVAQRETREKAARLIDTAHGLANETLIPANRLVELDRAWQALDAGLVDAAQRDEFSAALAQLSSLTRERGDDALKVERWTAQAQAALAGLNAAAAQAAAGTADRSQLAATSALAAGVLESAPASANVDALREQLRVALQTSELLDAHIVALDAVLQSPAKAPAVTGVASTVDTRIPADAVSAEAVEAAETVETVGTVELVESPEQTQPAVPGEPPSDPITRWRQLPPLADAVLAAALDRRFAQWQHERDTARQARRAQRAEQAKDTKRQVRSELADTLAAAVERAEAALAAGQLASTDKHLVDIDELLHRGGPVEALRSRIDSLQAEYARLKGWQHWGGGVARDELVAQAEALAAATKGEPDQPRPKLSIKQQSELVDDLRARWKELDKLGGATSRSLWQRFDEALKTAYEPVAEHMAAQRAVREQNLLARNQLVDVLNAIALPETGDDAPAIDWKPLAVELDRFHAEWRKLGPIEHTVPHKERGKLVERMEAAVQRLEAPLNEARRAAQAVRERFIERAKALAADAAGGQGRDLVSQVRELQGEWQQHAKSMPLSRPVENALWAEFKGVIDGIFSAREAVFNARDAEFKAHGAERAALIDSLEAVAADDEATPAALKRALADTEAKWQRMGPAPRQDAAALDARFGSAHDAVRRRLADSGRREWQATCDALTAKLALCEQAEGSADPAAAKAHLNERWASLPALPAVWEQALARRAAAIGSNAPDATPATDDLLLQLEAAFELASPPAFQDARRNMKLQAMKAALEGRQSSVAPAPDALLTTALGRAGLDQAQRERLGAVLAAVVERGPMRKH